MRLLKSKRSDAMSEEQPDDLQLGDLYLERQEILTEIDPHLQELILALNNGETPSAAVVSSRDGRTYVDVLAKLKDPSRPVPGLEVCQRMGNIVTGEVAIGDIVRVRGDENVASLKAATRLYTHLRSSIPEVRCDAGELCAAFPEVKPPLDGSGVVVGIVDVGCDFKHRNFRTKDSSRATRIRFLWDQRPGRNDQPAPAGFPYGREFDAAMIDAALRQPQPYAALGYTPEPRAHGTHVMDIAAGNGGEKGCLPGVAPNADLIFVHVAADDVAEEESLGNSRRLLDAVAYIFHKAKEMDRTAVVNVSLGTHGGPHDGTTLVEQGFEELLKEPGRAIVISAGNSRDRHTHTHGTMERDRPAVLDWLIHPDDLTPNELEIWYGGTDRLEVTLVSPTGAALGPVGLGETWILRRHGKQGRLGRIIHRRQEPNSRAHQIDILLQTGLPSGRWQVVLRNPGGQAITYHAWIERDEEGPSSFDPAQATTACTLGSICCGQRTIAVGSYDARDARRRISEFSAEGPTRDGRDKPEVSAPGKDIEAASAKSDCFSLSGTSMAAPHVTGLVALLFQAAGRPLAIDAVRQALAESVRDNPPVKGGDARFGKGRINGVAAVRAVMQIVQGTAATGAVPAGPRVASALPAMKEGSNGSYSLSELLAMLQSGKFDISVAVVERPSS